MKMITTIISLLLMTQIYAGSLVATGPKVEYIPFDSASLRTPTVGFQTFSGQEIAVHQLATRAKHQVLPLGQAMHDGLIELKTGDIFYSEEMKFVISPRGEFTGISSRSGGFMPNGRAPHTPK